MSGLKFTHTDEDITASFIIVSSTLLSWHIVCEYPLIVTCDGEKQKVQRFSTKTFNHYVADFTVTVGVKVQYKIAYDNGKEARTMDFESGTPDS